jgi:hypothetical protein
MDTNDNFDKDENLWQTTTKKNTIHRYEKYISLMPDGKYIQQAKDKIIELEKEQRIIEENAWNEAQAENTYFAVLRYKNKFPDCSHIAEVNKKLIELESSKAAETKAMEAEYKHLYEEDNKDTGFFAPEKKGIKAGVVGGIIMMAVAVIWFVVGKALGYIFFYPPILFVIGLFAFFKGLFTGNVSGKEE